ncbi:PadR family transcriptional regulator [Demequina sediminicola]|uniref:PadR family transcriptional regulator n=1 Tax=Demequina sediminicola TaxID=1095026 RepID=UPI0007856C50|nr:PadR family transcriptional regulator [Demequina sediminicola]
MAKTDVLSLAILGMLAEQPLHGYQIRKRLSGELGPFRALSYGSLYPCLKRMVASGYIAADDSNSTDVTRPGGSKRSRIAYQLTDAGTDRLARELASSGASSWDDEAFDVRFSLFGKTDSETRLRILEGRRTRLAERLEDVAEGLARQRDRLDAYTAELQRHGLERVEREVEWLDKLIEDERSATRGTDHHTASAGDK